MPSLDRVLQNNITVKTVRFKSNNRQWETVWFQMKMLLRLLAATTAHGQAIVMIMAVKFGLTATKMWWPKNLNRQTTRLLSGTQVKVDGPVRPHVQTGPYRARFSIPQYIDISRLENRQFLLSIRARNEPVNITGPFGPVNFYLCSKCYEKSTNWLMGIAYWYPGSTQFLAIHNLNRTTITATLWQAGLLALLSS